VYKSKTTQLWPILCSVFELPQELPFPVALYCGSKKAPIDEYLADFVAELSDLIQNGLSHRSVTYAIRIRCIICDAPARAYIKCTALHNAYHGCDKCTQKGAHEGRVIFPLTDAKLRSNKDFKKQKDKKHHKGISPLANVPSIKLVSMFPMDYMHLVCLGSMRKLMYLWVRGTRYFRASCSETTRNAVSTDLLKIKASWPTDFNKQPRALDEIERWKALEYRQFLLYLGPIVLKDYLRKDVFDNFMLFSVAITMLCRKDLVKLHADDAYTTNKFHITCIEIIW